MNLTRALGQAALDHGADPALVQAWEDTMQAIGGDVDADTAETISTGPMALCALIRPLVLQWLDVYQNPPLGPRDDDAPAWLPPGKMTDLVALMKFYVEIRSQALDDLPLRYKGEP